MSTKEKILESALQLFNKKGVDKVTTREIAKYINISQGNLHYHFPNKELLIVRLFEDFQLVIAQASSFDRDMVFTENMVLESMNKNYQIMYNYRFFFREYRAVWRIVPEIQQGISNLFEKKKMDIQQMIQTYQDQGVLRPDLSSSQVQFISDQFIFTISSWLTASDYTNHDTSYYIRFTFRIFLPYLTNDAMENWERLLQAES